MLFEFVSSTFGAVSRAPQPGRRVGAVGCNKKLGNLRSLTLRVADRIRTDDIQNHNLTL